MPDRNRRSVEFPRQGGDGRADVVAEVVVGPGRVVKAGEGDAFVAVGQFGQGRDRCAGGDGDQRLQGLAGGEAVTVRGASMRA